MVDVPKSTTLFFDCSGEEALGRSYAAQYAALGGVPGEYYVLKDQASRQLPGPVNDPYYGEPIVPTRPEETVVAQEQWLFREPLLVNLVITDYVEEQDPGAPGHTVVKTMTAGIPADDAGKIPCAVTGTTDLSKSGVLYPTVPLPGDVIWVGGGFNLWMDVDNPVTPKGYLKPGGAPVWYELHLVRRNKYFPERKVTLPGKDDLPNGEKALENSGFQNP